MKQNSILSYFQRTTTPKAASASSPPAPTKATNGSSSSSSMRTPDTPVSSRRGSESKRRLKKYVISSDEDEEETVKNEDEDEDDGNSKKRPRMQASPPPSINGNRTPNGQSTPTTSTPRPYSTPRQTTSTPSSSSTPRQISTPRGGGGGGSNEEEGNWTHMGLEFLKPEKLRDGAKRPPSHPDYDPKTLYVPPEFLGKCTPAVRQWWEMKANHYDTILFFKIGKFYELYHMDAVAAVKELNIDFMRGEMAHCGFPEIAYSKFSSMLVEKGHKVARIEQTETPDMMNERLKTMSKPNKFDKVVKREICQVTTKGVRCSTFQDGIPLDVLYKSESVFLYAIIEKPGQSGLSDVGVCFVDTTLGKFHIGQFQDDKLFSRLRTVFSHFAPAQILLERGAKLPSGINSLLNVMATVRKDHLFPGKEFWNEKTTLQTLNEEKYFWNPTEERTVFPESLKPFVSKYDRLCLTPEDGYELAVRSFGAVIWYLKTCLLEFDLLSLQNFEMYSPLDSLTPTKILVDRTPKYMVLDSETLKNLDISEGDINLLSQLDYCKTSFGKRLLRHWVCIPLANPVDISDRLDAIEELMTLTDVAATVTPILKTLPDLERLMSKVHTLGSENRGKHHPDSRAFFFEETKYSKRKVADLLSVLKGFKSCVKIINEFQNTEDEITSSLLSSIIKEFPSLDSLLDYFDNSFDHERAAEDGKIIPNAGVDEEYDSYCSEIDSIKEDAEDYQQKLKKELRCKVSWFGSDKKRFQIEVAENTRVPNSFEMSSSKKGFKRYVTRESKELLERIQKAEAGREVVLKDLMRRVFEKVDSHRSTWSQAIKCIATLDVLHSLTRYSQSQENMCRPKVVFSQNPFINVVDGRHPCVSDTGFIPNSSKLGAVSDESENTGVFALLTGPNMGGKSTLEKTMGLLTVLAQIGTFVPASRCDISIVDRIFTRVGANDNISQGESTFFVEMSETASILRHATPDSLVLMDELGRGTATYDGTAIAYAVTENLVKLGCRCYFSTHYHSLVEAVEKLPSIQLGHMACLVENENEDDPTEETITFLYKLVSGACPKSYGFNAARLAGLPTDVVLAAHKKAKQLEQETQKINSFRKVMRSNKFLSLSEAKELLLKTVT